MKHRWHDEWLVKLQVGVVRIEARERSTCVTIMRGGTKQCTAHGASPQPNTVQPLRTNGFVQSSLARSRHRRLIDLSKYRMCQRATAVNQPPFSPVFNTANNALDGFDVSRVQGPTL